MTPTLVKNLTYFFQFRDFSLELSVYRVTILLICLFHSFFFFLVNLMQEDLKIMDNTKTDFMQQKSSIKGRQIYIYFFIKVVELLCFLLCHGKRILSLSKLPVDLDVHGHSVILKRKQYLYPSKYNIYHYYFVKFS